MSTLRPKERPSPDVAHAGASTRRELAAEVIRVEARTIAQLEGHLGPSFDEAVARILACKGMVVVTGMGKAGLIGAKVSATLASTGTPSLSLHPSEALHGDLGRIRRDDVLLVLSNSGETVEIKAVIPAARKIGAGVIAITGSRESTLGRLADHVLEIGRVHEACPMGLAPTASTAAMLALGDALTMVVQRERGFSREEYALYHPAGALGRKLMRVREIMRQGAELPLVPSGTRILEVVVAMQSTPGRPGAALVVGPDGSLIGIFTDGDLRRVAAESLSGQLPLGPVDDFMGRNPKSVGPNELVDAAERILREHKIDQIPVLDDEQRPVGLLDIQDVLDIRF